MPILTMKSMKVMLCSQKCTGGFFLDSVFGVVQSKSFGGLSNNDGDGYENVTQKVKSRCFKLYPAYSMSLNLSYVGNFFL